jgi:polysaccharide biosynthesis protein PslE
MELVSTALCLACFFESATKTGPSILSRQHQENASLRLTREDEVETAIGVMQSRTIMEEVVAQIGPRRILSGGQTAADTPPTGTVSDLPPPEASGFLSGLTSRLRVIDPISDSESAVRALEKGLTISAPSKSSLISVEYKTKSPELAQEIVRTWVATYLQHNAKVNRTAGTYQFFRDQNEKLQVQLQHVHSEIRMAKTNGGFVTLEGQQDILESQLQNVKNELQRVGAELAEADTRVESYEILL